MDFNADSFKIFDKEWALVTAGTPEHYNTMTISWGGLGTLWGKPVATVYVKPIRYTHSFLDANDYFTVSFYPEKYRRALLTLGSLSGRDGDKVAKAGLTAKALEGAVTFEQAKITLLCKKIYRQELDTAAKGGISALTHALAVSLAGKVRVNSISPGWIDTGYTMSHGSGVSRERDRDLLGVTARSGCYIVYEGPDAAQHPAGRVGVPLDIANMVLYLCSDKGGKWFTEMSMGASLPTYDSMVVLTHFKGHVMGGFGGSNKNIGIGCVDGRIGKKMLHFKDGDEWGVAQEELMEKISESTTATIDHFGKRVTYQGETAVRISRTAVRRKEWRVVRFTALQSADDIIRLTQQIGFLPFFKNGIPGFSVEEHCPPELWFADDVDGPWEWKGPIARSGRCVYGKFFAGKAGFVIREWFPDFANLRRDGYDFDARFDDGLASYKDKGIYDTVAARGALLSKELKDLCNYRKGGNKGFDTVITRLQMQTYVSIADFVYMQDKYGQTYGWGVAKYSTPEAQLGHDCVTAAYGREPARSWERIAEHMQSVLPDVPAEKLQAIFAVRSHLAV